MPAVNISMAKGRNSDEKKIIFNAVHKALVSSFKIPETDRTLYINEYDPENMDGREGFVLIEVKAFKGRSNETKRALYKGIVENLKADAGIKPETVMIIIHDIPKEDWGIRGGQQASEVNLGFKTDV